MKISAKVGKFAAVVLAVGVGASLLAGCSSSKEQATEVTELTIYSGRSEEFIAPFFDQWQAESGIKLNIRYGDSAELAAQILEEGKNSPADLFLSQDAGSLGAVAAAELFTTLPDEVATSIPATYIAAKRQWVGVTGRARVFAYSPTLKTLPQSVTDLTSPAFKGILGIAPSNSSFQAFVTALINAEGEAAAEKWLKGLKSNGVKIYAKNSGIVEAIDKGEIQIGLVNHYYIWEVSEGLGREIKVKNGFFRAGDIGNLINVSGAGVLASSKKYSAAEDLINFLTSQKVQEDFVSKTHEYSLLAGATSPAGLPTLLDIGAPTIDLEALKNISVTQDLLVKVGLL
ncbi:MAG: iron ABC transporter substrate-binding protein [Candidatus Planktophila sp.]|nr:iron ABC transporter substrate-binding protein [Candidatus Planktophila sp.]